MAAILLAVAICLQHFVMFRVSEFPVTIAGVIGPPLILSLVKFSSFRRAIPISLIVLLFLFCLQLLLAVQLDDHDISKFIRTSSLWGYMSLLVIVSSESHLRPATSDTIAKACSISMFVIIAVLIAQSGMVRLTGNTAYYNLLGPFQYKGESDAARFVTTEAVRAPGLFLEPSYCGYVVVTLLSAQYLLGKLSFIQIALGVIGLLLTWSFAGFISSIFLLGYVALTKGENLRLRIFYMIMGGAAIAVLSLFIASYAEYRFQQAFESGTSTYYRFVGPIRLLGDELTQHPLGYAFGSVERIVLSYRIPHGATIGNTIDNGMYLLVFYFGWMGLLIDAVAVLAVGFMTIQGKRLAGFVVLYFILAFQFSGGILAPEFAVMSSVMILAARSATRDLA